MQVKNVLEKLTRCLRWWYSCRNILELANLRRLRSLWFDDDFLGPSDLSGAYLRWWYSCWKILELANLRRLRSLWLGNDFLAPSDLSMPRLDSHRKKRYSVWVAHYLGLGPGFTWCLLIDCTEVINRIVHREGFFKETHRKSWCWAWDFSGGGKSSFGPLWLTPDCSGVTNYSSHWNHSMATLTLGLSARGHRYT
jgi:hypothetical protein